MARLVANSEEYLRDRLGPESKVLLINPPVQEKRYHWLRWNQPMELLRLSTLLKTRTGSREELQPLGPRASEADDDRSLRCLPLDRARARGEPAERRPRFYYANQRDRMRTRFQALLRAGKACPTLLLA